MGHLGTTVGEGFKMSILGHPRFIISSPLAINICIASMLVQRVSEEVLALILSYSRSRNVCFDISREKYRNPLPACWISKYFMCYRCLVNMGRNGCLLGGKYRLRSARRLAKRPCAVIVGGRAIHSYSTMLSLVTIAQLMELITERSVSLVKLETSKSI